MDFSREFLKERATKLGRDEDLIRQLEAYADRLIESAQPVIFSPKHLALMMEKDYEEIKSVLNNRESFYYEFGIKKRSGGMRYIMAPEGDIKSIQYWIKEHILDKLVFPEYVTAYQAGKSIFDNAQPHAKQELILKFDLKNYFDTITQGRVYGLFQIMGYHKSVAIDLASACCVKPSEQHRTRLRKAGVGAILYQDDMLGVLPQGAPTSPALSNLAAFRLDVRLKAYAQKNGFIYTRYADDLTFSGELKNKLKKSVVRKIVLEEGFKLNERKGSYRKRSNRQIVTGLNVNEGVTISKKFRRKIATHIHNCLRFGPIAHLKKVELNDRNNFREWLLGTVLFINSIHPRLGSVMKDEFDRINWL